MTGLGYRIDRKLTEVLAQKRFTLSAEVIPPRNGLEQAEVFRQISALVNAGAEFLSVTKGAGGSLRGGSLPIAQAIKENFQVPSIAHFTCRDLTATEVENSLMDHHYFGIRNILALRGDPPVGQTEWKAKEGSYAYAYQLISQIRALNAGEYLERPDMKTNASREHTDFCIGCAVYPESENMTEQLGFFRKKSEAGAEYAITQMIFDTEAFARFRDRAIQVGVTVPILPGLRVLKSRKQARTMEKRFQVRVPERVLKALPEEYIAEEHREQVLENAVRLLQDFRAEGAPGVHVFVLADTELSCQMIKTAKG